VVSRVGFPSGFQLVIWVIAVLASVPLVRPALVFRKNDEVLATSEVASMTNLLVARNALIALNAIFAAYNALDVANLWAGSPPSGMSTQVYAHHGAIWLTVALAMMSAVVSALFRGPVATDPNGSLARTLGWIWLAQGVLLATGTYRRIGIHIATSGLSSLRIAGILGTTVVVIGVGLVAYKLFARRSMMWLVRRQLDAFALAVVVFAIAPTHLISARVNVERIEHGEYRPLVHISEQASEVESAAALLPLLRHPDVRVRQGVAAHLRHERIQLSVDHVQRSPLLVRDVVSVRTAVKLDARQDELQSLLGPLDRHRDAEAASVLHELQLAANRGEDLAKVKALDVVQAPAN